LTRPFDKHLDSDELDSLVSLQGTSVSASEQTSEPALREAQRHVESCQDCSRKLQRHRFVNGEISRMRVPNPSPPSPECMEDDEWLEVAAGLLPEAKTRELMKHAAQCGHCGPLLKNAADALVDEATPSEEALLASLQSARPEWRKNMAATLRASLGAKGDDHREKHGGVQWWQALFSWPRPALVSAGIAVALVAGWQAWRALHPPSADQLLAQAYTERRTLEVRIPGAKYAPMRVERGIPGSSIDKPPAFLKAEALIGENLRQKPNDLVWLQAKARADLLDGNYDSAINTLKRALEGQPDNPSLLADLGAAYYVRAETADRPVDFGNAIESLGKALTKTPDDPVALFNRALACERMFLFVQALDDWEHYLRVDPEGAWAEEAHKRLDAIKEKLQQHEKSQREPLLGPVEIARAAHDPAVRAKIDDRIEEYFHVAITNWLPHAFPEQSTNQQLARDYHAALEVLAQIAEAKHGDRWLAALLSKTEGARFPSAVLTLASTARSYDTGDYSGEFSSAQRSAQLFRAAGNLAGELSSQAEEVYAEHLLYEGEPCMSLVRSLRPKLEREDYRWLQAKVSLEEANCLGLLGDWGAVHPATLTGTDQAKDHGYLTLYLGGLGFQADEASFMGDDARGFLFATEGLKVFWSRPIESTKGYNFYTDLDTAADNLRLPNLQVALWRQATTVIDADPDVLQRAMAHRWYGNSAYLANMTGLAADEFAKASALFAAAPQTAATIRRRMDAEIWLARIEARQGDLEKASIRLQQVQPILEEAPSFETEIGFYSTEAEVCLRRSDFAAAESSLRSAIFLAEWALSSLPSEDQRRQWAEQTQDAYRNLVAWKFRQGDSNGALELWEWYKGAEVRASFSRDFSRPLGSEALALPDAHQAPSLPVPTVVAESLPQLQDQTVIVYAASAEGIAIWAYDDRGVSSRWVAEPLSEVQNLSARFSALCSDPSSDLTVLRTVARSLYDLLIAPIEDRIGGGRVLLFEPDDALAGVPLDVLIDSGGRYLAQKSAVATFPGLYLALQLRPATRITSESSALVVSVPSPGEDGWTSLAEADNEAKSVVESLPYARWLRGQEASLSAIRQTMRNVSLFHFAGHAVATPERDGLVLAEHDPSSQSARLLNARSLSKGDAARLQLAVLSACQTGTRPDAASSGNEGLAEKLLHAGVPHVITTRWNIDSAETAVLMKQFYSGLLAGEDAAASLRAAKLALASQPHSMHPYYWAAFELNGVK
jgi:CHAT domain-containing protein/tetratricopeptide (TPR) repeat protein